MEVAEIQENYASGWIKIYRSLKAHWIFSNAEYLRAWIIILLSVNHKNAKSLIRGELIDCKRGQSIMSIQSWVEEFGFGWSLQKVRTFFSLLEKDKMIHQEGLKYTTRLTVCEYDSYQSKQLTDNKLLTISQLTDNKLLTTIEEVKEYKNIKNGENSPTESLVLNLDQFEKEIRNSYKQLEAAARRNKTTPDKIVAMIPDFIDTCRLKAKTNDTFREYCNYFSNWLLTEFSNEKKGKVISGNLILSKPRKVLTKEDIEEIENTKKVYAILKRKANENPTPPSGMGMGSVMKKQLDNCMPKNK